MNFEVSLIKKSELREQCIQHNFEKKPLLKVIKEKCLDCCCGQRQWIETCTCTDCSLWPYRFGTNPFSDRGSTMTEEQRQAAAERFRNYHKNKINEENEDVEEE